MIYDRYKYMRLAAHCQTRRTVIQFDGPHGAPYLRHDGHVTLVPLETVSKMLGHKRIITIKIYARITYDKIGQDMTALSGNSTASSRSRSNPGAIPE